MLRSATTPRLLALRCLVALPLTVGCGLSQANGAHTAHQFAVTESGAATITVPIQVPPGIAGMEPQLSLNYSSGAGNGLFGLGWTLAGPSAITRCPKTLYHDGVRGAVTFGAGDRYCLDSQRLVIVDNASPEANYGAASTQYRTERDSFSRITALGNYGGQTGVPSSFKVETKAGLILEFGISANSQVETKIAAGVGTNTINRWMLQRISDRNGNYVEFRYCGGEVSLDGSDCTSPDGTPSGSKVLHYIRYTNRGATPNGTSAVVFNYEARPDRVLQFHAGSSAVQTQRVSAIDTYIGFSGPSARGALVRRYLLGYESLADASGASQRATNTSRLVSIQERDASNVNILPAISMTYAVDSVFDKTIPQTAGGSTATPRPSGCGGVTTRKVRRLCP